MTGIGLGALTYRWLSPLHENLTLEYTTFVPSTTESIVLPSDLSGTYVIEVVRGEQHFWGEIEL